VNQHNSSISNSAGGSNARKHARKHVRKSARRSSAEQSAAVWRQGAGALCASDSGSEAHLLNSSETELKSRAFGSSSNSSSKEIRELKRVCSSQQSAITTAVRCVMLTSHTILSNVFRLHQFPSLVLDCDVIIAVSLLQHKSKLMSVWFRSCCSLVCLQAHVHSIDAAVHRTGNQVSLHITSTTTFTVLCAVVHIDCSCLQRRCTACATT
jgi:hypothetical protein